MFSSRATSSIVHNHQNVSTQSFSTLFFVSSTLPMSCLADAKLLIWPILSSSSSRVLFITFIICLGMLNFLLPLATFLTDLTRTHWPTVKFTSRTPCLESKLDLFFFWDARMHFLTSQTIFFLYSSNQDSLWYVVHVLSSIQTDSPPLNHRQSPKSSNPFFSIPHPNVSFCDWLMAKCPNQSIRSLNNAISPGII